jgi:POLQ-like helicase
VSTGGWRRRHLDGLNAARHYRDVRAFIYTWAVWKLAPATASDQTELKALGDLYAAHFGETETATLAARRGILSHHGDTPHGIRLCVEYAMKEGLAKFVVCTSTLAQGVKLPIRYLIVSGTMQGNERIKVRDFHNLLGRAGRAGMHTEGTIIFSDPKLYDLRHGQRDSWRWEAATELLDPGKTESTASSLLELLAPFTNDTKRVSLKLDIVGLLGQLATTPEKAYQKLSRAAKKFEEHGFSEKNRHGQLTKRCRLLEALESYVMANRGAEPFPTFLAATEQLATETLAYHLADDEQRSQLVRVFSLLAEHIETQQPDMNIQAVFGRTLLGLVDSARINTWVAENTQALIVAGGSDTALLGLLLPLITELLVDTLGRYLPPAAVLPVVHSWIAGDTYAQIMAVWLSNGGAIRHGEKTRKTKMQDIVQLCENDIGYESTLIVAAVAEILGSLSIDGATSCIESLGTLLKRLKYGIAHADEIALYELGFADRVVAQTLRPIIASAEGQTARRRLRNSESAVRDTLERFPRYFSACLSSLL